MTVWDPGLTRCFADCAYTVDPLWGPVGDAAMLISIAGALLYGFVLAGRQPSILRTVLKSSSILALAVLAAVWDAPPLLLAALVACAIGDAFLAGDPKRWLVPGMLAFLVGHVLYIFLFAAYREPGMEPGPVQTGALAILAAASVAMLAFLWKHLGVLRPAVVLYVVAIAVMTGSSFLLGSFFLGAIVGSIAFMASDAVLAIDLFREEKLFGSPRATAWAVWFLYYGAQVAIASAFMGLVR